MRKLCERFYNHALLLCFSLIQFMLSGSACAQRRTGFGGVANEIMDPVTVFSDFVNAGCIVIGGSFLFASIIKYIEHRRSPTMVPISTVIFLLLAGLILVALPLLSFVADGGIPFTIFYDK